MSRHASPMTQDNWPTSDELWRMLHHLFDAGLFSTRKQLLFCVGVCRLRDKAMPAEYLPILDDLESFADEPALALVRPSRSFWEWCREWETLVQTDPLADRLQSLQQRAAAVLTRRHAAILRPDEQPPWEGDHRFEADEAVSYALMGDVFACCYGDGAGNILRSRPEADLLRELIPDPFRSVELHRSLIAWNDSTVRRLAEAAYDDRQLPSGHLPSARLAVLTDALLDAGCDKAELLEHLRSPGPHWRGCFALDAILGKE